ncbi:MAG: hypothetical protein ABIF40_06040 [archaeon]
MIRELLSKSLYTTGSAGLLAGALMFSCPLWNTTFREMPYEVQHSFELQRVISQHENYLDTITISDSDIDDDISDQLDSYYHLKAEYDILLLNQDVIDYRKKMLTEAVISVLGMPTMVCASIPFFLGLVITQPYTKRRKNESI